MNKSLPLLLSMLLTSVALAEPPASPPNAAASALVDKQLIQPLRKGESKRKKFSRAAPVPKERRVRVLDTTAQTDARGKHFVRFAVDVLYPFDEVDDWNHDVFVGCVYLDEAKVFIRRGSDYLPASSALGGRERPQPEVCRALAADAV